MPSLESLAEQSHMGEDTQDLLHHIAWTEVVQPALEKHKADLTTQLTGVVLKTIRPQPGQELPSVEQIAGRVMGIDFVIKLLTDIVKKGKMAREALAAHGIYPEDRS